MSLYSSYTHFCSSSGQTSFKTAFQGELEGIEPVCSPLFNASEVFRPDSFQRESIFKDHLLQKHSPDILAVEPNHTFWFFVILFIAFVLFAWIISFNSKRMLQLTQALFSNRGFSRFTRDGDLFGEQIFFPLMLMVLSCFSLFAFKTGSLFGWLDLNTEPIKIYGQVFLLVGVCYLVKVLLIKIFSWVFKEQAASQVYLTNMFIFNIALTLVFLPLLLLAFFSEPWVQTYALYTMIVIALITFIWRFIRTFFITATVTNFSYVHNFLYLCTLEIGYALFIGSILMNL